MLVTGGAGFIGSNFVHYWLNRYPGDQIIVLDKLTYAGNRNNLRGTEDNTHLVFVQGDICDRDLVDKLLRKYQIETIVNFAAESHVDQSILDSQPFVQTNIIGTQVLLESARQYWLMEKPGFNRTCFHQISTDEVYGDLAVAARPCSEEAPYIPSSPYSASKAAADHLVRAWHRTYGLNTTISICSNNFGPRQHSEKLIPLTISRMLENKPVPVYGDGKQVRDWIAVEDHVRGIDLVLRNGRGGETWNIGVRNELVNIDVVRMIGRVLEEAFQAFPQYQKRFPLASAVSAGETKGLIEFVADRPGHDRRYALDPSKIERELGFKSATHFEEGLRATVRWYLDNSGLEI